MPTCSLPRNQPQPFHRSRPAVRRGARAAMVVLAAFLFAAAASGQDAAGKSGGKAARPGRGAAAGPRIWWNQPRFIDGLELTGEQLTAMNASLEKHLGVRREQAKVYQGLRSDFGKAVAAGDWSAAQEVEGRMTETAAELARVDSQLVIDVARLLSDEQRAKLQKDFPNILRRPWLLGGQGMGGGAGARFNARAREKRSGGG